MEFDAFVALIALNVLKSHLSTRLSTELFTNSQYKGVYPYFCAFVCSISSAPWYHCFYFLTNNCELPWFITIFICACTNIKYYILYEYCLLGNRMRTSIYTYICTWLCIAHSKSSSHLFTFWFFSQFCSFLCWTCLHFLSAGHNWLSFRWHVLVCCMAHYLVGVLLWYVLYLHVYTYFALVIYTLCFAFKLY